MKSLLAFLVLVCTSVQAMTFEGSADLLYYRPSTCELGFAIADPDLFIRLIGQSLTKPTGREVGPCLSYELGFKLGACGISDCGDRDVRLGYSRLHTSSHQRVEAPDDVGAVWLTVGDSIRSAVAVFTAQGITGFIEQQVAFNWDALDLEAGSCLTSSSGLALRYHFGLHWADLRLDRNIVEGGLSAFSRTNFDRLDTVDQRVDVNMTAWGIGPRIGFDGRYEILCGLGVTGHAGLGLLGGEATMRTWQEVTVTNLNTQNRVVFIQSGVSHRSKCALFPEIDMSLALSYQLKCRCLTSIFELGYEFRTYFDALQSNWLYMVFEPVGKYATCSNLNISGLYLRALVSF